MPLDENNTEPMYVLGRLWALCEAAIQENGSVVPGHIANQMTLNPMAGWALLHNRYILHAAKLVWDRREYWDRQVAALVDVLPASASAYAPTDEAKGLVSVGYHHQKRALGAGQL